MNWKFVKDLGDFLKNDDDPNDPMLMDIGTCSLHIAHGAFKTAHNKCEWTVHKFLRSAYFLFKDFPSRRAQYKASTGSSVFPRKFCAICWVENAAVCERAIAILPSISAYIQGVAKSPQASENFKMIVGFLKDKLLAAKLGFLQSVALQLEEYLVVYQSNSPLLPFLYGDLCSLIRNLLARFLKKTLYGFIVRLFTVQS